MIDGVANNNVFGLASSGNNGGQAGAQPVSMETIEQIQVSVAPFDVRHSGFTGGAINAITKSGTNKFHGSAYYYGYNQDLIGIKYPYLDGTGYVPKYQEQTQYTWVFFGAKSGGLTFYDRRWNRLERRLGTLTPCAARCSSPCDGWLRCSG